MNPKPSQVAFEKWFTDPTRWEPGTTLGYLQELTTKENGQYTYGFVRGMYEAFCAGNDNALVLASDVVKREFNGMFRSSCSTIIRAIFGHHASTNTPRLLRVGENPKPTYAKPPAPPSPPSIDKLCCLLTRDKFVEIAENNHWVKKVDVNLSIGSGKYPFVFDQANVIYSVCLDVLSKVKG